MQHTGPDPESLNTHEFATARLEMTVPEPLDAGGMYALIGGADREEVAATMIWEGPDAVTDIEVWIERCRTTTFGDSGFHWCIRDRTGEIAGEAGAVLGSIGTRPESSPGRADVGYWIGRPFWGRGVMSEALAGLVELGFTTLDYYKLEAEVFTNNLPSQRVVRSCGFALEGTIRRAFRKRGEFVDLHVFGLLREEWEAQHR